MNSVSKMKSIREIQNITSYKTIMQNTNRQQHSDKPVENEFLMLQIRGKVNR